MLNNKNFWGAQMAALGALYVVALGFFLVGQTSHPTVLISALLLGVHALEIPLSFFLLKGRSASVPRLIVLTLLFGVVWSLPARRGVFKVH